MSTDRSPSDGELAIAASDMSEALGHLARFVAIMADRGGAGANGAAWPATLGIRKACEYLDIGETKFRELVNAGELPKPFPLGGRPHWLRGDLDRFIRKIARRRG